MSGNAFEWTLAENGGYAVRGSSYRSARKMSHLAIRSTVEPASRDATLGLRLCATPPAAR